MIENISAEHIVTGIGSGSAVIAAIWKRLAKIEAKHSEEISVLQTKIDGIEKTLSEERAESEKLHARVSGSNKENERRLGELDDAMKKYAADAETRSKEADRRIEQRLDVLEHKLEQKIEKVYDAVWQHHTQQSGTPPAPAPQQPPQTHRTHEPPWSPTG